MRKAKLESNKSVSMTLRMDEEMFNFIVRMATEFDITPSEFIRKLVRSVQVIDHK